MRNFEQQTEYLAKLMAQENINIKVSSNLSTASFDLKSRTLHFPLFENLKSAETDLIIGHEIAHALETPSDQWINAINNAPLKENNDTHKSFYQGCLNIIEDARIERLIKNRYPGMKKVFHYGYNQLFDRGLFGDKEELQKTIDSNKSLFIERLNYHFKIPNKLYFKYNDDMNLFINKILQSNTFDDVISITNELYEFSINEITKNKNHDFNSIKYQQSSTSSKDDASQQSSKDDASQQPSKDDASQQPSKDDASQQPSKDDASQQPSKDSLNNVDNELTEFNERNFENNYNKFLHESSSTDSRNKVVNVTIPEAVLENIIVPYKEILRSIREKDVDSYNYNQQKNSNNENESVKENELEVKSYYKFVKKRKNTIDNYTKTFQMKKKAHEFNRTLRYKTGSLDSNRLSYSKVSDNIFKTNHYVAKGKNHAYIMIIDFSSSMGPYIRDVIKQALEIIAFCRNSNIPVNVYAFSNSEVASDYSFDIKSKKYKIQFKNGSLEENYKFCLLELFHHKMKHHEFTLMADSLLTSSYSFYSSKSINSKYFYLAATPLVPTVMTVPALVKKIRKETQSEIVHCIFLTDGMDTTKHFGYHRNFFIQDFETKKCVSSQDNTNFSSILTKSVSMKLNNVQLINFFISSFYKKSDYYREETDESMKMGFDKFYYVSKEAFKDGNCKSYKFKQQQKVLIDSFINVIS